MKVLGVRVELPTDSPIVLLQEDSDDIGRIVPIFIGQNEATAIALALEAVKTPRPMTHDLIHDVLMVLGVKLDRAVVVDLRDKTFYAELHLKSAKGIEVVSCRSSDAVAVAVRTGSPIYASEEVLEKAGFAPQPGFGSQAADEEGEAEVLDEFREFIDNVNPDDFAG